MWHMVESQNTSNSILRFWTFRCTCVSRIGTWYPSTIWRRVQMLPTGVTPLNSERATYGRCLSRSGVRRNAIEKSERKKTRVISILVQPKTCSQSTKSTTLCQLLALTVSTSLSLLHAAYSKRILTTSSNVFRLVVSWILRTMSSTIAVCWSWQTKVFVALTTRLSKDANSTHSHWMLLQTHKSVSEC